MKHKDLPRIRIGGFKIAAVSRSQLVELAFTDCMHARSADSILPKLVFDANGHALSMRATHSAYRQAVDAADIIHADGGFLIPVSRWRKGPPIPERSATTDMIHDFAAAAEERNLSFYLLGGTEAVNAACAERLIELYPRLRIVGRRNGYFSREEEAGVISEINSTKPDIVWIGLGKPKEQIFAVEHRSSLRAAWLVTCGGCFNYITGAYSRAPKWMQRAHLEWLYRAFSDPRAFMWRYVTTTPHALWLALVRR